MSYIPYKPDLIEPMFFRVFNIKPYVFDPTKMSLYECVMAALKRMNEVITEINDVGTSLELFEKYVLEELSKFDLHIRIEIEEIINKMITDGTIARILEYKNCVGTLSVLPSQVLYNKGETVNGVMLKLNIVNGTNNITEIKLYKNGSLIHTKNVVVLNDEDYLDGVILNTDTEYYYTLNDGVTTIQSNKINIKFVNDYYTGLVLENDNVNEVLIKSLTPIKMLKGELEQIYIIDNKKIVFGYPSSYGELTSIFDSEDYDVINSFVKSVINITLNGEVVPYNVYASKYKIINTTLKLKFTY